MELSDIWELFLTGILRGGLYSLMAVGLALVLGVMNINNFAHAEFYMLGAYIAYFAHSVFGLSPVLAILFASLTCFVAGALVEKALFYPLRRRSQKEWIVHAFLLTLGLSTVLRNGALAVWGGRFRGITHYWEGSIQLTPGMGISVDRGTSFIMAIFAIAVFWLFLRRTRMGRAIRAVAQNESGAAEVGIDIDRIQTLTFALSCMLAGFAGATLLSIIPAYPTMGAMPLAKSWYVVILAGLGNIRGAIIGGFIVGMLESISYYWLGAGWQDVVSVAILIIILLVKPSGLFGTEVKGVLER